MQEEATITAMQRYIVYINICTLFRTVVINILTLVHIHFYQTLSSRPGLNVKGLTESVMMIRDLLSFQEAELEKKSTYLLHPSFLQVVIQIMSHSGLCVWVFSTHTHYQ